MKTINLRFPEGKNKAVTLSYDDGVEQDIRLIDIMQRHGLKGTFNINSGYFAKKGTVYPKGQVHRRLTMEKAVELYNGHGMEVAVHGVTHPFLEQLPINLCTYEVLQDRMNLEREFNCMVRGMAYPYGTYSDMVVDVLKACGIVYSRTTKQTERFDIPMDWLRLPTTCKHTNPRLMELADLFLKQQSEYEDAKLFYLWGHSYEFEMDDNWNVIEEFAKYVGNRPNVWYATNIEIYEYIEAYNRLVFSLSDKRVYNPSCREIYFATLKGSFSVKAGETIQYQ